MKFATPVAIFVGLTLIAAAIFASSWMNKDVGRFQSIEITNYPLILDSKTGCVFGRHYNSYVKPQRQPIQSYEGCRDLRDDLQSKVH